MKPTVLLVEEAGPVRELQVLAMESQGWQVTALADLHTAITLLHVEPAHVLVVAAGLLAAGATELESLGRTLKLAGTALRIVAFPAEQDGLRQLGLPGAGFLDRPLLLGAMVEGVRQAFPPAVLDRVPLPGLKVLVADDDPVSRKLLQLHLMPLRFELIMASDGVTALELARRRAPDLVLADALMPGMDGFRLCLALRQDARLARVPILLTHTVVPDELDLRMAHNVGANGFVRRTQEGDELVGVLLRELRTVGPTHAAPLLQMDTEEHLYRMVRQLERRVGLLEQAERTVRESEARFRLVVNGSYDGIWDWDLRRQTLYWSPRLLEMLGLAPEAFEGTHEAFMALLHPEDRQDVMAALSAHLERGVPYDVSFRLRHVTGGYRSCVSRGRVLHDAQGRPVRMAGIVGDVTEQLRMYRETQEAVRARDEFLSVAAHELRTPLTSMRLHLQLLQRQVGAALPELAAQLAPRTQVLERQLGRLGSLVNTLLDVSRLAAGKLSLEPRELDLAQLVRQMADAFAEEFNRAGSTLSLHVDGPLLGSWDPLRVEQVLVNLLSNAAKYGAGRPVEVSLAGEGHTAVLAVKDHGIGISEDGMARLFGKFERAVSERHYGGLGLGLYITRQIVEAMGGSITVRSAQGQGSTFILRLPTQPQPPVQARAVRQGP
ncbi:ATP-binding protein [Pyxidicoccus sp. 3LFB2]